MGGSPHARRRRLLLFLPPAVAAALAGAVPAWSQPVLVFGEGTVAAEGMPAGGEVVWLGVVRVPRGRTRR